jgi:hypothetical protein
MEMSQSRKTTIVRVTRVLIVACLIALTTRTAAAGTVRYVLLADQSTLVQTGGIAGVHWTYQVQGQFVLSIDPNAGTASFVRVDANATDSSPYHRALDPNKVFALTSLTGTVASDTTLEFTGKAADGSAVRITATLQDNLVHLIAQTTPPAGSADFFVFSMDATAQRKYAGGTGEQGDPYQIATAAYLIGLGNEPNDYAKCFILTADIDLDPNLPGNRVFDRAVIAHSPGHMSSFRGTAFSGEFDGNAHVISRLTIKGDGYLGLFGALTYGASVRNLGLADVNITGSWDYVGGLGGENGGSVAQCYSTGSVSGRYVVGGLLGAHTYANVVSCCCSGSVSGEGTVGGLVGGNSGGLVGQCYSVTRVIGLQGVGGLIGYANMGHVVASFWDIQASGQTSSAGGTGKTTPEMRDIATYLAAGWDFVDEIKNGTSQLWQMPTEGGYPLLAIFVGHRLPRLQGLGTPAVPYLISDALDLGALTYNSRSACYRLTDPIDLSGTSLHLPMVPVFGGTFDGNNVTISHLTITGDNYVGLFGKLSPGSCVKNLGVVDANIAGSGEYVGAIAGSNGDYAHWIVGINGEDHQMLEGGDIVSCHSTGKVHSDGGCVGGLVGFSYGGHLNRCSSGAEVSGYASVGGLVGDSGSDVDECRSCGAISAVSRAAGGFVGENKGSLLRCYSTGSVSGVLSEGGGLVGCNLSTVTECYSTATVSGTSNGGLIGRNMAGGSRRSTLSGIVSAAAEYVTSSFWDIQASGRTMSDGGTGKTTAAMKMAKTFTDAGWDFVEETKNGTEDIWWIDEGKDYPHLSWEKSEEAMQF